MDASPSLLVESLLLLFLLLLCPIMFNSISCSSSVIKVQCNEKDKITLLNFKQGVIDPSGMLSSWFTQHDDCCEWLGVHCDNITGRVTELNLPCHTLPPPSSLFSEIRGDRSKCLTGELHLSLLQLEFLNYLNLSDNNFKSIIQYKNNLDKCSDMLSRVVIPHPHDECVKSSNLRYLDLSYNYDIVIDNLHWISNLSSLEYLNLNGINLHKEIDWIPPLVKLPSLTELSMMSCQLENLYPSLEYVNFTSLKVLNLAYNEFGSKLPGWLFNLSSGISHIYLYYNNIHGQLPKTMPIYFRSIKTLDLTQNYLDGSIPNWLGQLEDLQELSLLRNSFTGPIPHNLGNISSLIVLDLTLNQLNGGLPENLGKLFNLEALGICGNFFTGNISQKNLKSLSNLKQLSLGSPALIFDFDHDWIPPFQLFEVFFANIGPKLPSWLFKQSSLNILEITDSTLSFEPHNKFWNIAPLEYLYLTNNIIDANMSNVLLNSKIIFLDSNTLRSGLPQISTNVVILKLRNNSLFGSIAPLLCHKMKGKSNLQYLDLSYNNLSGGLSDCWMHWKSLFHVDLGYNSLTGKIPESMGLLSKLISLQLNKNKLFGEVPLSLKNCQTLWILNLAENKFCGSIPDWTSKSIKALVLRSNEFSGNIPSQICELDSLKVLDFADNRLFGPIPSCLNSITSMVSTGYASIDKFVFCVHFSNNTLIYSIDLLLLIKGSELYYHENVIYLIDLSSNSLSGTIPLAIYELTRLQSLNLSHNQLNGMIPQEIGYLKQLESFDLSYNHFLGEIPQSLSNLSYLSTLNLSFNNFTGKIPSGTQLQGFTNLSYNGNPNLCGPPLINICPQVENFDNSKPREEDDGSEEHWWSWFYMGMGIGFATGFWATLGLIFFNRSCRHAYFGFIEKLHIMVTI